MPNPTTTSDPARTSRGTAPADDVFDAAGTHAALITACNSLSPAADKQSVIAAFASTMTHLARGAHGTVGTTPHRFRQIGRATSQRELDDLASHARKFATLFERLHEPAILALAEAGLFGTVRLGLPAELRLIADQCEASNVENMSITARRGRKENTRAIVLGRIAARAYSDLTGRHPTYTTDVRTSIRTGPWPRFLKAVFQAMEMDGYGDHLVKTLTAEQKDDTLPEK
jgi:hypothetical protein